MRVDVLVEFVDAQQLGGERRVATEEGGLEALRRAYRDRHQAKGLCVSCCRPVVLDMKSARRRYARYCAHHRAQNIARARASQARRALAEAMARE